jgi:hypothetical protein
MNGSTFKPFKSFNRCAPFNRSLCDLRSDDLNCLNGLNVLNSRSV